MCWEVHVSDYLQVIMFRRASRSDNILPAILRQFSKRSPKLFRSTPPIVHSSPHASADSVKGTLPILENTEAGEEAKLDDPAASEEHESPTGKPLSALNLTQELIYQVHVTEVFRTDQHITQQLAISAPKKFTISTL